MTIKINIEKVAEAIGVPAENWKGRCYEISCMITDSEVIPGVPVYGHYNGKAKKGTLFGDYPVIRHGWIVNGDTVIDPTRWVFEGVEPYIYVGSTSEKEYDRGGDNFRLRLKSLSLNPMPAYDEGERTFELTRETDKLLFTEILSSDILVSKVSFSQLLWAASLPLTILDVDAKHLYSWLDKNKLLVLVPKDYQEIFGYS